ncbi:hypothetical protein FQZ97_854690 [compost metagenome]
MCTAQVDLEFLDAAHAVVQHVLDVVRGVGCAVDRHDVVQAAHHVGQEQAVRPLFDAAQVAAAVAQQRHQAVAERGEHQLLVAVGRVVGGERFAPAFGVEQLHALAPATVEVVGHHAEFGQAVAVDNPALQHLGDLAALVVFHQLAAGFKNGKGFAFALRLLDVAGERIDGRRVTVHQVGPAPLQRGPDFIQTRGVQRAEKDVAAVHRKTLEVFARWPGRHRVAGEAAGEMQLGLALRLARHLAAIQHHGRGVIGGDLVVFDDAGETG